jgi:Domain of unknown function (DUF4337)
MSHGAGHHGVDHGSSDSSSKRIAIFITVIGLFLAVAETMAKGAQTNSIASNVQASNLWSFYQAKTIRQTSIKTAAEQMEVDIALAKDPAVKERLTKRVADWRADVERYQSEPKTNEKHENVGEGRKELSARAIEAEKKRDVYTNQYHCFEIGSAAFQIAIVMASVYLLTHVIYLLWMASGLMGIGLVFSVMGILSPGTIQTLLPH